ncbi:hypothetical protein BDP55DRAFT_422841 [Colletotrichum godetiae]|uniref:Uncharacterized protein n=1 Tax=Colletotrichum godetiae TaxID=1209918 RepID=A0AAJ0A867_9PEZI|nr:uncharacterized protein BDP55DRAFT_422841 [Colletotrichum godetiae]KAK1657668.1 hypothetical protein BDP55DRAFT_422841 [Colletotrichum godetiae]
METSRPSTVFHWHNIRCEFAISGVEAAACLREGLNVSINVSTPLFQEKLAFFAFLSGCSVYDLADCTYDRLLRTIEHNIDTPVDASDGLDWFFRILRLSGFPTSTSASFASIVCLAADPLGSRYKVMPFRTMTVSLSTSLPWPGAKDSLVSLQRIGLLPSIVLHSTRTQLLIHRTPAQANIFCGFLRESYQLWMPAQPCSLHDHQILLVWLATCSFPIQSIHDWLKSPRGREMLSTYVKGRFQP